MKKLISLISLLPAIMLASSVTLTWNDNSDNEDGFRIERSIEDGPFELVGITPANTTSWIDDLVQDGIIYQYRVNAFANIATDTGTKYLASDYTNIATQFIEIAEVPMEVIDRPDIIVAPNAPTTIIINLGIADE